MPSDKETLLSMGFEEARVNWALKETRNSGLQPAMDHILSHEGQPVPDLSTVSSSGGAGGSSGAMDVDEDDEDAAELRDMIKSQGSADVEAKSIKCSLCGKTFRNTALANFHAEKSGHDQFEESIEEVKPLTEEEKKQKLAELREKMAAKRAVKAKEEAKEAKENEAIRRKQGKDLNKIKEDLKAKEIEKEIEQRRRDKVEDAKARAAIKAQIEADRIARAERTAREKALREGREIVDAPSSASSAPQVRPGGPAAAAATTSSSGVAGKDFKETRLQIRLATGGQPLTTTLSSEATLREVAEFVAAQTLTVDVDTVSFAQHFPRKQFERSDFSKSLRDLGLTPSAVLIAS
ncbi:hypothetical protein CONPUDRAFT_159317 [Coniophora puteana RWD-64-598 SS2]|uniref:UBX domain-containing protein n=1 Tax=Coniophora puteana (strain RWD-64-598) TaxID=741705 RepID=A0A5M3M8I3_CONPW|nr:uncharacterized protein CONPUDRAFT_159317 [Coniophora puteana RWD-64-598 SS2]EIW75184.1 hypothetical protein CONPUDRAFT_159317 [Coniophora puteana RWD-64-598 SS2]